MEKEIDLRCRQQYLFLRSHYTEFVDVLFWEGTYTLVATIYISKNPMSLKVLEYCDNVEAAYLNAFIGNIHHWLQEGKLPYQKRQNKIEPLSVEWWDWIRANCCAGRITISKITTIALVEDILIWEKVERP